MPAEGFEPPTTRLRSGCSTAELRRLASVEALQSRPSANSHNASRRGDVAFHITGMPGIGKATRKRAAASPRPARVSRLRRSARARAPRPGRDRREHAPAAPPLPAPAHGASAPRAGCARAGTGSMPAPSPRNGAANLGRLGGRGRIDHRRRLRPSTSIIGRSRDLGERHLPFERIEPARDRRDRQPAFRHDSRRRSRPDRARRAPRAPSIRARGRHRHVRPVRDRPSAERRAASAAVMMRRSGARASANSRASMAARASASAPSTPPGVLLSQPARRGRAGRARCRRSADARRSRPDRDADRPPGFFDHARGFARLPASARKRPASAAAGTRSGASFTASNTSDLARVTIALFGGKRARGQQHRALALISRLVEARRSCGCDRASRARRPSRRRRSGIAAPPARPR